MRIYNSIEKYCFINYRFLLLCSLFISVIASASPTLNHIPLPQLRGTYTNGQQHTTSFDSGLELTNIDSVAIELRGFYSQGILMDINTGQLHTIDSHIKATAPLEPELWSTADIQPWQEGSFIEAYGFFNLSSGASWDFMLDGSVEVRLKMPVYAYPAIYTEVRPVSYSISDAYLLVHSDCNSISIMQPNTREYLLAESVQRIEWYDCRYDYYDIASYGDYFLSFSVDGGMNWEPIYDEPISSTNYYDWQLPDISTENCLIKIEDANSLLSDISNVPFAIYQCSAPPALDLNGDCYLNLLDHSLLAAQWQESSGYNLDDLIELVENWLNCRNTFDPDCTL